MKERNINEFIHRTFKYYTNPIGRSNAEFTYVNMHGLSFTSTKMANKTLDSGTINCNLFLTGVILVCQCDVARG